MVYINRMQKGYKSLQVPDSLHTKIKTMAAKKRQTIIQLLEQIFSGKK